MLTALASIAFLLTLGVAAAALFAMIFDDAEKILAAFKGRSFVSQPESVRPMTVRFSPRYPAPRSARSLRAKPALRAVA